MSIPAFAAAPSGGSVTATNGSSTSWDGFPGPAYSNDQVTQTSTGDANCTDGTNCDTFTLTLAPGDYTGKRARFSVSWTLPSDDYDVYVHAASNAGALVSKSAGGPPATVEANTWDINGVVTQGVNDKYTVHVVYFTVGPLDAYHGTVTIESIPTVVVRTPKFVWGSKTRMKFSKSRALYGNGTATGSEPSIRADYEGNVYVGSIRGVPGGNDLWRLDLNPNSPTFDPFLRAGSAFIDANGNIANPAYKGQPDATSPDQQKLTTAGDGGGDMDIAVGFKPPASHPSGPPAVATTSLAAADISSQRSFDRGDSFMRNPDANITVPVDDRNWMEFYGGDTVYLAYREFTGLVATSKFYINRSDDGGFTYGPAVLAALGGNTTGNVAVDQADGTVYFCYQGVNANQVMVTVGHPISPAVAPAEYSTHVAATGKSATIAALFPVVKVAKDGTVYVAYSDGGEGIYLAHSRDQGNTWSQPVRVSDPSSTTSLLPWMAAGDAPGAVAVAWMGNSAATSEDKQGLNNDAANWQIYFAQTFDATATNPTFYEAVASDHIIHAANISLGGFGGAANRNLGDFFQIALDPQGMAVFAFSDDSNDFSGNPFVIHQTGGYSLHTGNRINLGDEKASAVDASAPQVVDGKHDAQIRTGAPTGLNDDSPVDIVNIRYSCESTATGGTILGATMKLSGLTFVPPQGVWRMHFTSNPSQPGISDRGDQWYVEADTDAEGNRTYVYGSATRTPSGGFTYTRLGNADVGRFDLTNGSVTVKVDLAKLNAVATRGPIASGSVLTGLRGSARAVYTVVNGGVTSAGAGVVDSTRGGTSYTVGNCTAGTLLQ